MGWFFAVVGIVMAAAVGALYWIGRDIEPDDGKNPPYDVRRIGGGPWSGGPY
jgi:hypothetical protein